jgi:site-specific DNA-methyltransferase (adenine-specific)
VSDDRVIRIGENLFVNDDCVAGAREHVADGSVDLIITDPPYGISGDMLHQHYNRDESFVVDGYIEVPVAEYNAFSRRWIAEAERVLKPGGTAYIVSGYTNLYHVLDALRATTLREVNHIIWKFNFGVYTSTKFVSSHYHILFYEKPGGKRTFNLQSRFSTDAVSAEGGSQNYRDREDVWIINREYKPGQEKNKNELPRALLQKMLQYSTSDGDLVCDFFMGGCSTAAVAIGMNRRFVGFEASRATFASRVPLLTNVRPGELLESIQMPEPHIVEKRGKSWEPAERERAMNRFAELRRDGRTKKDAVSTLSSEFGRGSWAIQKLLRNNAP